MKQALNSRCGSYSSALRVGLLLVGVWGSPALADRVVDAIEPVVISDDVTKHTTAVESAVALPSGAGGAVLGVPMGAAPGGGAGSSSAPGSNPQSKSNNGHGNNADGVDSSNPGQGQGGPNGAVDSSCGSSGCVDDESSGGGSIMSKNAGKGK